MEISKEFGRGYLMVAGTLFTGAVLGVLSHTFKFDKNFTAIVSLGGLILGGITTNRMLKKIEETETKAE